MTTDAIIIAAWSLGLVGLAYAGFTVQLWRLGYARAPRTASRTSLIAATGWSCLWGLLGLAYMWTAALPLLAASAVSDVLRYGAWFAFLLSLLGSGSPARAPTLKRLAVAAAALTAVAAALQVLPRLGIDLGGAGSRLAYFGAMTLAVFALILLEQVYRNTAEDSRWNVKPLVLGLAGTFAFDLYLYSQSVLFNSIDVDALSIRGGVHALMAPLLVLSVTRRADWISKVRISRQIAFHSATLLIAGAYLVFISGIGYYVRYFGGEWGRALQVGVVFLALIVLITLAMSGTVRAKLRVFLGKHFFRYRYDYREEWLKFTQTLASQNSPAGMGLQAVRGLADMLESPGGGLWMKNDADQTFSQAARWNIPQITDQEAIDSNFARFLADSGWVVNLEEYRSFRRRYGELILPDWMHQVPHAWLIVPLVAVEELIGFVVLVRARTPMDVNWEVNDLLKTAGRQAASFLAQMRATEALLEVRKFDAFNRMSAFVVHDLKNIVTQLSLMLKNAKRLQGNPEFQQDMLMTVENSLDRMRQLMLQLREGATPSGAAHGVDLAEIAQRIAAVAAKRGRQLELELVDRVVTRGHEERLERIMGHMVQNAFDATDAPGRVWLKLERNSGQARVEVGDTGQGMSAEFVRDRLFKPFQTTKQAGMGIGAYESFQYVQELGGKIQVDSEVGKGTRVTILLPLFDVRKSSDLQMVDAA